MSWMQKLYEAYDAAAQNGLVGKEVQGQPTLWPMYHAEFNAPIEVTISPSGEFVRADVIEDKASQRTLMPCTEASASRTSGIEAMPLFDKLMYIAGDFAKFLPSGAKSRDYAACFDKYLDGIRSWLPTAPPEVRAWAKYVEKRRLIGDLVAFGLLPVDTSGKVPDKWTGEGDKPAIYRAVAGSPLDAFVRFRVLGSDGGEDRVWMLPDVRQSFIDYQNSLSTKRDVCYVRGEEAPVSKSSPKFIRYPGDGAKLVSANDSGGFTYRGRFFDAGEALSLGRDTTEKAHSALRWLIQKQGYRNGEQVILAFATGGKPFPSLGADTAELDPLMELGIELGDDYSTNERLANQVSKALAGYQSKLSPTDEAIVIGLDSATTGRLSMFYYREARAEDLFARILGWHSTCAWRHTYRSVPDGTDDNGKPKYRRITFVGAPAPADIIKTAYGENVGAKQLKNGVERLLPCIADGAPLPPDIVRAAARRASQRVNMNTYEQDKALSIACALIRKYYNDKAHKEVWSMALQPEVGDRSYLFGRALAYAEQVERYALREVGEKRPTNAERLMVAFAKHPAKSWMLITERLQPYLQRLGAKANRLREGMEETIARLGTEAYTNEPLNEKYLLGYACQKQEFARLRDESIQAKNAQEDEEEV